MYCRERVIMITHYSMADSPYDRKKHHPCINKRKRESLTPKIHEYQNFFNFFSAASCHHGYPGYCTRGSESPQPLFQKRGPFQLPLLRPLTGNATGQELDCAETTLCSQRELRPIGSSVTVATASGAFWNFSFGNPSPAPASFGLL